MRIAIAGIVHETNTYVRDLTELADFQVLRDDKILRLAGTESQPGGALEACARLGATAVPILRAFASPSGTIAAGVYAQLKSELLERLADAMPVQGVFLDLHGAGVAEGCDDLEADLARDVRGLVGNDVPITAAFDLHGNITQRMAEALDGVFVCREYPHIDQHLRAAEAIELIHRMVTDGIRTDVAVATVPILMPTTTTFEGPGKRLRDQIEQTQLDDSDVVYAGLFHGFPYADVPHVGAHVVVTGTAGPEATNALAKQLGRSLWAERESFRALSLSAEEAVAAAQAAERKPVVINETSDNCGGGAPGDGTHLLRAMLDADLQNACFGFIVDPEVAAYAHESGVGSTININLGGKYDTLHGEPLALTAYVKALHDGRCVMQAMAKGVRINYGKLARLQVQGLDIVVGSERSQTFDTEPFVAVGIDVRAKDVIALKSSNHFRAGFEAIAGSIITADPPGLTTHHVEVFERQTTTQRLWPIHDDAVYP